ncbi:hypothetical protein A1507_22390 [Methylomonas koyamae]|uniref:Uncharacterized protein n=1 Tax=Methylomonas koyamae TaxID=702114 RepID=A0A177NSA4_9GAMM|nr:hypothetical protein A1507_22390 [Methylomonas koyamae]
MIMLGTMSQSRQFDTRRQHQIRQVNGRPDIHPSQIDFDELRQHRRHTHHLDISHSMSHNATLFDTNTDNLINKVQRNMHFQTMGIIDTHEIHMQNLRLRRMTLNVLQNRFLSFAVNSHIQDVRINRFMRKMLDDLVMIQYQHLRRSRAAVDNRRHFTLTTNNFRRSTTHTNAGLRNKFKHACHYFSSRLPLKHYFNSR